MWLAVGSFAGFSGCSDDATGTAPQVVTDSYQPGTAVPGTPPAGSPLAPDGTRRGANAADWRQITGEAARDAQNFVALPNVPSHRLSGALEASDPTHPVDDSYYDEYRMEVPAGAPVRVYLSSDDFDPYLYVFFATTEGELDEARPPLQNDDWKEDDRSAFVEAEPTDSDSIAVVWVNSVHEKETGTYQLRVSVEP